MIYKMMSFYEIAKQDRFWKYPFKYQIDRYISGCDIQHDVKHMDMGLGLGVVSYNIQK